MKLTESERHRRDAANAEIMKARRAAYALNQRPADVKALAPFAGMTRHVISKVVDRERMRFEAETIRGHKMRAADAAQKLKAAKAALAAHDRLHRVW